MNKATLYRYIVAFNIACGIICIGTVVNVCVHPTAPPALAHLDCCQNYYSPITLNGTVQCHKEARDNNEYKDPEPPTFSQYSNFIAFQLYHILFTWIAVCLPKMNIFYIDDDDDRSTARVIYMATKYTFFIFGIIVYFVYVLIQFFIITSSECTEAQLVVIATHIPWVFILLILPLVIIGLPIVAVLLCMLGCCCKEVYKEYKPDPSLRESLSSATPPSVVPPPVVTSYNPIAPPPYPKK